MILLAAATLKLNCEIHKASEHCPKADVMAPNSPQDQRQKGISWV